MYQYDATVISTHDGDTVKLDVIQVDQDLGFHVRAFLHMPLKFRLHGINAPPGSTEAGKAATAFLAGLLPVGTRVVLDSIRDKAYKYGDEWMAILWLDGEPQTVNQMMIDAGHAVAWDGKGPRPGG